MQASLTGHLVMSSLHAVDAAAAVHRFGDMGIEPFLIASAINAVVGQRLLRRICPACRETGPTPAEIAVVEAQVGVQPDEWTRGVGCNVCGGTGYRGRTGVYELVTVDDHMRTMIHDGAAEQDLERHARTLTPSIRDDGRARVMRGETTMEEILRVTREDCHGRIRVHSS